MSDHWELYPAQVGEHIAWITYDHGVHEHLGALPETALEVRIRLREANADGHPTGGEFDRLAALRERVTERVRAAGGDVVGRLTLNGHQYLIAYADLDEPTARAWLGALQEESGAELGWRIRPDPERQAYWSQLFPGEDDWQVVLDRRVVDQLRAHGDRLEIPRRLDHVARFPTEAAARAFATWAAATGYHVDGVEAEGEGVSVAISHELVPELFAVARHTVPLRRRAVELGGAYDGWGCEVVTDA